MEKAINHHEYFSMFRVIYGFRTSSPFFRLTPQTMFKLSGAQVWALISMSISTLGASILPQYHVVETRGTVSPLLYFIQETIRILFDCLKNTPPEWTYALETLA